MAILVDIYVPAVDQTFDFHLEEKALVQTLSDEIGEMIMQMVQNGERQPDEAGKLLLCSREQNRILPEWQTLEQCGIHNGSRLFVV